MSIYRIHAVGTAQEIYTVEAESEDDARSKFELGDGDWTLVSTEVFDIEIERIEKDA